MVLGPSITATSISCNMLITISYAKCQNNSPIEEFIHQALNSQQPCTYSIDYSNRESFSGQKVSSIFFNQLTITRKYSYHPMNFPTTYIYCYDLYKIGYGGQALNFIRAMHSLYWQHKRKILVVGGAILNDTTLQDSLPHIRGISQISKILEKNLISLFL